MKLPQARCRGDGGGPTDVYVLQKNSLAIDWAIHTTDCPSTDQRGFNRPLDGNHNGTATCDAGAVEQNFTLSNTFLPIIRK